MSNQNLVLAWEAYGERLPDDPVAQFLEAYKGGTHHASFVSNQSSWCSVARIP